MKSAMLAALGWLVLSAPAGGAEAVRVKLRTRAEAFKGSGNWQELFFEKEVSLRQTAIVICDMWDHHWCSGAEKRVGIMAPKMARLVDAARARGVLIVHAPSDTMQFYKEYPQRQRMLALAKVQPPASRELPDPPLPIDDKEGGCDTGDKQGPPWPWTRQHAAIRIAPEDFVSDKGVEVYSLLRERGISTVLIMGVHTNMCILNRTFAIKQMTRWGVPCILVRDMTDAMYDPAKRPFVSHEAGTELVIQHIEKHWCPTTLSTDLLRVLK